MNTPIRPCLEPWARKIRDEEKTEAKQKAFKQANTELNELEQEIQAALNEDYTLEQIASALRDPRIAEEAEKSMSELETLHARIKKLAEKKKATKELLEKFEKSRARIGGDQSILQALEVRETAVQNILEKAVIRDLDDKEIPLELPEWERDNFEEDIIYTRIEESSDVSKILECGKKLVGFAAQQGEIDPDTGFKTEVRVGDIDYARKVSKNTSDADRPLFAEMDQRTVNVWMNAGLTKFHLENRIESGLDRLIIVHKELLDSRPALLATLVHELMHAYFENQGNYTHREIHKLSIKVLAAPIKTEKENKDFTMEQLLKEVKPLTRRDISQAFIYAVASETLFPDR